MFFASREEYEERYKESYATYEAEMLKWKKQMKLKVQSSELKYVMVMYERRNSFVGDYLIFRR